MAREILEGEVLSDATQISKDRTTNTDIQFAFPGWRLLLSFVPVVGLFFSVAWFYFEKSKKPPSPMIMFAVGGIIVGIFSTTTFLVLKFIFKAIF